MKIDKVSTPFVLLCMRNSHRWRSQLPKCCLLLLAVSFLLVTFSVSPSYFINYGVVKHESEQTIRPWGQFYPRSRYPIKCKKCSTKRGKCASSKKEFQLKSVLKEWARVTNLANIETFLAYGSLLANVHRRGEFIKWDTDIDVIIWAHDTKKLEDFAKVYNVHNAGGKLSKHRYKKPTFYLAVQPEWRLKYHNDEAFGGRKYHEYPKTFVAPNARLYNLASDTYVDIWPLYCAGTNVTMTMANFGSCPHVEFVGNPSESYGYSYPLRREDVFPLNECELGGVQGLRCPQKPEVLLKSTYGSSVSIPDHYLSTKTGCWETGSPPELALIEARRKEKAENVNEGIPCALLEMYKPGANKDGCEQP